MRKLTSVFILLLLSAACQKETKVVPIGSGITKRLVNANRDTIPDNATFRLKLIKDAVNSDDIVFLFNHTSKAGYDEGDAPYFTGTGQINLASISSDGRKLAINYLPYTPGMTIDLDVQAKADSVYALTVSSQKGIPADIRIWLKDKYMKDSVDVRSSGYNFNVQKSNPQTFGSDRFKLVLWEKQL